MTSTLGGGFDPYTDELYGGGVGYGGPVGYGGLPGGLGGGIRRGAIGRRF